MAPARANAAADASEPGPRYKRITVDSNMSIPVARKYKVSSVDDLRRRARDALASQSHNQEAPERLPAPPARPGICTGGAASGAAARSRCRRAGRDAGHILRFAGVY